MSEGRDPAAGLQDTGAHRVSWLELFYDLVFVAAIITFSEAVAYTPDAETITLSVGAFAIAWWIWLTTTLFANRYRRDDPVQRALILVQMLLLSIMAIAVGDGTNTHPGGIALLYALLCLDVAVMHARMVHCTGPLGELARSRRNEYALATIPLFLAAAFPGPGRWVLWPVAVGIIVVPGLTYRLGRRPDEAPIDDEHLMERFGLLTILVLGEAFVKVALVASEGTLDDIDLFVLPTLFVLVFALWWSYFDDVPEAGMPNGNGRLAGWFLGHLGLEVFIVGIAVGYSKLLRVALGHSVGLDRMLLTVGPLLGVYLALAAIGACSRREPRRGLLALRVGSAAVLVPLGILIWRESWISVDVEAIILAVFAFAHAAAAAVLRRRTHVTPA